MTSLNNIAYYFKFHRWLIISLSLIALLSIAIITKLILMNRGPKPVLIKAPEIPRITTTKINSVQIDIKPPVQTPKSTPVYSIGESVDLLTMASNISNKLTLSQNPVSVTDSKYGDGLLYSNNTGALAIYSNYLFYQSYPKSKSPTPSTETPQQLKTRAVNFISSLGLPTNFSEKFNFTYNKAAYEVSQEVPPETESNSTTIFLNYAISDMEIIDPVDKTSVNFDSNSDIRKLSYTTLIVGEEIGNYQIISAQNALKLFEQGEAPLFSVSTQDYYAPIPQRLDNVDIRNMHLAYYLSGNTQTIQPVWAFEGTSQQGNLDIKTTFILPAISR